MRTLLMVAAVVGVLWWLNRSKAVSAPPANSGSGGTAPDVNGDAPGTDQAVPGTVPNAYNPPADDRSDDPVVKIAQAAGWDNTIIPVLTVDQAVARSEQAAAAADALNALAAAAPATIQVYTTGFKNGVYQGWWETVAAPSTDTLAYEAAQQASIAANPWYASATYNGDAAAVAGQIACGAQASGNQMGRVLDSSFCRGGPHYGADPMLSTGVWP